MPVLIATHLDEVGWLVSHVEQNGYLRLRALGVRPGCPVAPWSPHAILR